MKLRNIGIQIAAVTLMALVACDKPSRSAEIDPVPPNAVQPSVTVVGEEVSLKEPHRYVQLSNLAAAIRNEGYACEDVRTYKQIEPIGKETAAYRIDCLEYSYRLTVSHGRSHVERINAHTLGSDEQKARQR